MSLFKITFEKYMRFYTSLIWGIILVMGCGSSKQLGELEETNSQLQQENLKLSKVSEEYSILRQEYASLKKRNVNTEKGIRDLISRYDSLNQSYSELITGSQTNSTQSTLPVGTNVEIENKKLREELKSKQQTIWDLEMKLDQGIGSFSSDSMSGTNDAKTGSSNMISDQELIELLDKLNDYLIALKDTTIQLTNRDGHLYLILNEHLLFNGNSRSISRQGGKVLFELSRIIKNYKKSFITIIGHSGVGGSPKQNWEFSTGRATEVVNSLINSGLNPNKLTASGRSQFDPIAKNNADTSNSINNRIEIVISSKKLF